MTVKRQLTEAARLDGLRQYRLPDTGPEQKFDDITHLAAHLCATPAAWIVFVDENRPWTKSRIGIDLAETSGTIPFCAHTILGEDLLCVPDTIQDERFADHPLVTGEPRVRFYAGMPLITPDGLAVGTLCVVDMVPRDLEPGQRDGLKRLARQVMALLAARPAHPNAPPPSGHASHQVELQQLAIAADLARQEAERISISEARYRRLLELANAGLAKANADLRARAVQQEAVADLGNLALTGTDTDRIFQDATALVVTTLGVEVSTLFELSPDADCLRIRANSGWEKPEIGAAVPVQISSQAGYALLANSPTIVTELASEVRFEPSQSLIDRGVVSSLTVIVAGNAQPFGTLGAMTLSPREFTVEDVHYLTTVANVLAAAVERKRITTSVHELNARLTKTNERLRNENSAKQLALDALSEVTNGLKSAKEDAERARETADLANDAKSELLSRMSHELRTPLNAILGFGQVLEEESLPPLSMESVKYIVKSGRHLLGLVNEVLDLARVEAGNSEFSMEAVEIGEITAEVCAMLRSLAAERQVSISNAVGSTPIHALVDRQRLKQILINLVANAIKYNHAGGQVEISCHVSAGLRTIVSIRDTGPGIAPADFAKLFVPFERLGAPRMGVKGTGLGLVLTQRLVKAMAGHLSLESNLGMGSTFAVDFPHAEAASPVIGPPEVILDRQEPAAEAPKYSVLCIEDNPSNLRLIEVILSRRPQIRLISAIQGSIGLELARTLYPDLILLDLNLPDMQGQAVLAELKDSDSTRNIPVVIVSADATQNQIDKLLQAGARAYLTKPLNVLAMLQTVDEFLGPRPDHPPASLEGVLAA